MINILTVCGNGMGTSTIIKIKLGSICKELGVKNKIESCSAGESGSYIPAADVIVTTPEWAKMMRIPDDKVVITLKNLMDGVALKAKMIEAVEAFKA